MEAMLKLHCTVVEVSLDWRIEHLVLKRWVRDSGDFAWVQMGVY